MCVCAGSKCLYGPHSILVVGLGVVITILTPFVCECVLKEWKWGIVRCGISKQAIVNIVCAEWRPPKLRAAFEDIVPEMESAWQLIFVSLLLIHDLFQ